MTKKSQPKENIFDRATRFVNDFEDSFVNFISAVIPWLVPLIPAYILYGHLRTELEWEPFWAFIAGTVVEGLGLATVNTYFRFERHNRRYIDKKNKMPVWVVIVAYVWYLAIVLLVNVVLDWVAGRSWTTILAILAFSTLSLPASALISVRGMFTQWRSEHDKRYARSDEPKPVHDEHPERSNEQPERRPSDYEREIIEYLNLIHKTEERIPGPTEVAKRFKLDVNKAKGYISGKTKDWEAALSKNGAGA